MVGGVQSEEGPAERENMSAGEQKLVRRATTFFLALSSQSQAASVWKLVK